jgi:hypothetical protein
VYVDEVVSYKGSDVEVTMVGPQGETVNYTLQLLFVAFNNIAKYEALFAGCISPKA